MNYAQSEHSLKIEAAAWTLNDPGFQEYLSKGLLIVGINAATNDIIYDKLPLKIQLQHIRQERLESCRFI